MNGQPGSRSDLLPESLWASSVRALRHKLSLYDPKKRPAAPGDDLLPDRTLAERNRAFQKETIARRDGFEVLKAQAERERAELEGYAAKKK